ncbi:hypothetical protein D9M69_442580 [compost metagenome]
MREFTSASPAQSQTLQRVERELYKQGVDYQTVADTGHVIEQPAPAADRSRDIPF